MTNVIPAPRTTASDASFLFWENDDIGSDVPVAGADGTRSGFDHLSDPITRALAVSNPDNYFKVVRGREQNDRNLTLRGRRRHDKENSRLRSVRTAEILVITDRATKRTREGVNSIDQIQIHKVYGGNLRRVTPNELRSETRRDDRRKNRKG